MKERLPAPVETVLFACVHNAGRSQMAATAMREVGVDLSNARTQRVTQEMAADVQRAGLYASLVRAH